MSARDTKKNETASVVPEPRYSPELVSSNRSPRRDEAVLAELEQREVEKKKRSRRHLAVLATLLTFLLGMATLAAGQLVGWWSIGALDRQIEGAADKCEDVGVVPMPRDINVQVLNGTATAGLANALAEGLGARDFSVRGTGNTVSVMAASNVTITYTAGQKSAAEVVAANFESPVVQLTEGDDRTVKVQVTADGVELVDPNVAADRVSVLVDKGQELQNLCQTGR